MKKLLLFIIAMQLCIGLIACGSTSESPGTETPSDNPAIEEPADDTPSATMGEQNALSKAGDYLAVSAFSYSGLVEQLKFEGYTDAEAKYGVDNCGADWNEQAALKAQEYLDISAFSRQGLIDQLKFEGFTESQAKYGVESVG